MHYPLDLDLLKTFVAVVESGNFSSAAPRVGRSQSAISMQMQRLEEELGRTLLVRMPRTGGSQCRRRRSAGLCPAPAAACPTRRGPACRARRMPAWFAWACRTITPPSCLPPVLARFAEDYPLVNLELVCEPSRLLVPAVEEGRIDLAIVTRLAHQPFEVVRREPFVWVASPHHVAWSLDPLPVALFELACAARMNVVDALSIAGRSYRCTYSSASLLGLCAVGTGRPCRGRAGGVERATDAGHHRRGGGAAADGAARHEPHSQPGLGRARGVPAGRVSQKGAARLTAGGIRPETSWPALARRIGGRAAAASSVAVRLKYRFERPNHPCRLPNRSESQDSLPNHPCGIRLRR